MSGAGLLSAARWRRTSLAVGACLASAAIAAPGAAAHVGQQRSVVAAGPYRLVIYAGAVAAAPRPALGVRGTLTNRTDGALIGSASVRLDVADQEGRLGSYRMTGYGGTYSLLVPIPNANSWRSLRFLVTISGPLGVAVAVYRPPGLLTEWLLEPTVLLAAGVALLLFLQGFVRLRRRGRADLAPAGRVLLFALGLVLMVGALVSPLDPVGDRYLLSAHMLEHLLLGDAGPALLVLAVRGPLVFFLLPRMAMRRLGHLGWLRHAAAWMIRPRVVLCVWALAYGCWHIPAAYDYAATHQLVHDLEHASFVLAGLLVWTLLIDPAGHRRLSRGQRLGVAAGVFALGTVVADVLIFSLHPLYPLYAGQAERVFGLSALHDQQIAGLVMAVEQILTLGTFAACMLVPVLRSRHLRSPLTAGSERLA